MKKNTNNTALSLDEIQSYVNQLSTQLKKGFLTYCILLICKKEPVYTSEIITILQTNNLIVVEGTLYPLLTRLQRDGLLAYEWQESQQGPPRKYYEITESGIKVRDELAKQISILEESVKKLQNPINQNLIK